MGHVQSCTLLIFSWFRFQLKRISDVSFLGGNYDIPVLLMGNIQGEMSFRNLHKDSSRRNEYFSFLELLNLPPLVTKYL